MSVYASTIVYVLELHHLRGAYTELIKTEMLK